MRKYNAKRANLKPGSQEYIDEHKRTPRWFAGRTVTVVDDPRPYPLCPDLVLDRHATATMAAEGCFTNGMQLRVRSTGQVYIVTGAKE